MALNLRRGKVRGLGQVVVGEAVLFLKSQRLDDLVAVCLNVIGSEHAVNNCVGCIVVALVYGVIHSLVCARQSSQLLGVIAIVSTKLNRLAGLVKRQLPICEDVGYAGFGVVSKLCFVRIERIVAHDLF